MRYRRPRNKGQRCQKWQRVRGKLRCKSFTYPRRRFRMGYRPGHVPANLGRRCVKFKLVKSPWYNKKVYRCASYGPHVRRRRVRMLPPPRPATMVTRRPALVTGPPGRIPLSLPSMEKQQTGRTPI